MTQDRLYIMIIFGSFNSSSDYHPDIFLFKERRTLASVASPTFYIKLRAFAAHTVTQSYTASMRGLLIAAVHVLLIQ